MSALCREVYRQPTGRRHECMGHRQTPNVRWIHVHLLTRVCDLGRWIHWPSQTFKSERSCQTVCDRNPCFVDTNESFGVPGMSMLTRRALDAAFSEKTLVCCCVFAMAISPFCTEIEAQTSDMLQPSPQPCSGLGELDTVAQPSASRFAPGLTLRPGAKRERRQRTSREMSTRSLSRSA
jgi:hypothetical protein